MAWEGRLGFQIEHRDVPTHVNDPSATFVLTQKEEIPFREDHECVSMVIVVLLCVYVFSRLQQMLVRYCLFVSRSLSLPVNHNYEVEDDDASVEFLIFFLFDSSEISCLLRNREGAKKFNKMSK